MPASRRLPPPPLSLRPTLLPCILLVFLAWSFPVLHAQRQEAALSDAEVEQIRDSAATPNDRVLLFIKLLNTRSGSIHDLTSGPRRPGREQDIHDLLEQFTALADELSDNLDDYGPAHRDVRKALPKLLDATERWASTLKSPPEDGAYNVSRKLALEAIRDLREETTRLIEEQRAWFLAHPPAKDEPPKPARQ